MPDATGKFLSSVIAAPFVDPRRFGERAAARIDQIVVAVSEFRAANGPVT